MIRIRTGSLVFFLAMFALAAGCGRTKELERQNREQAQALAALNEELARLKEELAQSQPAAGGMGSASAGTGTKSTKSLIK